MSFTELHVFEVDRAHAGDYCIGDVLRGIMIRAVVRKQGRWNNHLSPPFCSITFPASLYSINHDSTLIVE
jgi:hypothetical protein